MTEVFDQFRERLHENLGGEVFGQVVSVLNETVNQLDLSFKTGDISDKRALTELGHLEAILDLFPNPNSERFLIDSAMLCSVVEQWQTCGVPVPQMIVPRYHDAWGHQILRLPTTTDKVPRIGFVTFQGRERLSDVRLLEHPWMLHELGHELLYHADGPIAARMNVAVEDRLAKIRLAGIGDKALARDIRNKNIAEFEASWMSSSSQQDWCHEIGADAIALVAGGPVFSNVFIDFVRSPKVEPFRLDRPHPPYELRAKALAQVARKCGFTTIQTNLEKLLGDWSGDPRRRSVTNHYEMLCDDDLLSELMLGISEIVSDTGIPIFDQNLLNVVEADLAKNQLPEWGIEIMLAARLCRNQKSPADYKVWEKKAVAELLEATRR